MKIWIRIAALLLLAFGFAQSTYAQYQEALDNWSKQDYFVHTSTGVSLRNVATGEVVASHYGNASLIPASNLKVLTTASALAMLGPNFVFRTRLAHDGVLHADGVLEGNLYIIGSGDPSLGSPKMEGTPGLKRLLEQFRLAVQQAGIRQINGRIIADDEAFSSAANGSHWQWLDMGNYYGCGTFGLNVHENLYYLRFQQRASLGATPPVAVVEPAIPGLQFTNEVTSAERGSGDNAYIYGAPYTYRRHLRGTIPVGSGRFTIKGAIPDPPLFLAQQLANSLENIGIIAQRPPATIRQLNQSTDVERTTIFEHQSPGLAALVERTNMESVNLYAEALLRAIGFEYQQEGSVSAGLDAIKTYWTRKGLDFSGVQLYDGSGMAPRNVYPAHFMTNFLRLVYADEQVRPSFIASLPLAGRSGSLRNSLKNTAAQGRLRAKTGSLEQVRCYTGYFPNSQGTLMAFSIMINNYEGSGAGARKQILGLLAKWSAI